MKAFKNYTAQLLVSLKKNARLAAFGNEKAEIEDLVFLAERATIFTFADNLSDLRGIERPEGSYDPEAFRLPFPVISLEFTAVTDEGDIPHVILACEMIKNPSGGLRMLGKYPILPCSNFGYKHPAIPRFGSRNS